MKSLHSSERNKDLRVSKVEKDKTQTFLHLFIWLQSKAGWYAVIQIKWLKGNALKKLGCCLLLGPIQWFFCQSTNSLHALLLPHVSNIFALNQPDTSQVNSFAMNLSKQISQHTLHLPSCLMKQGSHIIPIFSFESKQMHMSSTHDILITSTFWRKVSASAVS